MPNACKNFGISLHELHPPPAQPSSVRRARQMSAAEFRHGLAQLKLDLADADVSRIFTAFDTNRNGAIEVRADADARAPSLARACARDGRPLARSQSKDMGL